MAVATDLWQACSAQPVNSIGVRHEMFFHVAVTPGIGVAHVCRFLSLVGCAMHIHSKKFLWIWCSETGEEVRLSVDAFLRMLSDRYHHRREP